MVLICGRFFNLYIEVWLLVAYEMDIAVSIAMFSFECSSVSRYWKATHNLR